MELVTSFFPLLLLSFPVSMATICIAFVRFLKEVHITIKRKEMAEEEEMLTFPVSVSVSFLPQLSLWQLSQQGQC